MKRKYTSIILAVLIMATIATFPLMGCKTTVVTPTTSAETTTETTVEAPTTTTAAPTTTTVAPTSTT